MVKPFTRTIKKRLIDLDMSQSELAKKLEISQEMVNGLITGRKCVSITRFIQLSNALELSQSAQLNLLIEFTQNGRVNYDVDLKLLNASELNVLLKLAQVYHDE